MAGKLSKEHEDSKWNQYGLKILISSATHPIEYAKVLMQIGHEPIAPRPTTTLFGKPVLALPNLFQYISYIKSVDGVSGCFRGLSAKLAANVISGATYQSVKDRINFETDSKVLSDEDEIDVTSDRRQRFAKEFMKDIAGHTAAVISSHPFQVIAVRMMAQFVGNEDKYSSLSGSVVEIYKENGLAGFFSGLVPRLIGDLLTVCFTAAFTYLIHSYLNGEDEEIRNYSSAIIGFIATAFTYPFHVVSNCMVVSSSGLKAGTPPQMPDYKTWLECWSHLKSTNQMKRGSSLLWRYYTGPFVVINNKPVIINKDEFVPTTLLRQ